MFPKPVILRSGLMILAGVLLLGLVSVTSVGAQEATPRPDEKCISCHESLYLLHDTGKWFCLCAQQMTCTCCHGGNAAALTEEQAHAGMVVYPTLEETAPCQGCHPTDYPARIEKFASLAGVHTFHPPAPTLPLTVQVAALPVELPTASPIPARLLHPWRLAGLGLILVALVLIGVFGYRCWKADCLSRNRTIQS